MTTPFELWLYVNHYRPTTLRATAREVESARRAYDAADTLVVGTREFSLRRYATFLNEHPNVKREAFELAVLEVVGVNRRKHRGPKPARKQPVVSFPDGDWDRLREAVSLGDEPEAYVLRVQFLTGYRIGDVLGVQRDRLRAALRSGVLQVEVKTGKTIGAPIEGDREVWEALYAAWPKDHETLAMWVCPRAGEGTLGPYQRVRRYFLALGVELGIDSRVHLHRIRRTIAVKALRETRDIHLVSQLLGHASIASTQIYTDELRADDIANLQKRLREDHGK